MLLRKLYYWKKMHEYGGEPPDQIRENMLRSIIESAADSEFYDFGPDTDYDDLPVLSDEVLRKMTHTEETVRDVTYFNSSGTTGTVRATEIDAAGYDWMCAYTMEMYTQLGWRPGQRVLAAPRNEQNRSSWIGKRFMPITTGELEDHRALIDQINSVEPAVIKSYPRVLVAAARAEAEITHTPTAVIVTGELLTPQMRADLEEAFGTPVLDFYGAAEVGRMAIDTTGDGFELLRAMTRTELPDGIGRPIATTLVNTRTPVVRYRLPDLVEADGDDTIHRILGRTRHVIHQDHGPIYPADLIEQIYQHPDILDFTIGQGDSTDLHIRAVTRGDTDPEDRLNELLEPLGLSASTTVVQDPLPITPGGKKRTFTRSFGSG